MKSNRTIGSAVLLLALSITLPVFAQKGEEEKGGSKKAEPAQQHQAQPRPEQKAPAQHQQPAARQQQAQHQAQPQRAEQAQRPEQAQAKREAKPQQLPREQQQAAAHNEGNNGHASGQYGRISNASYGSHFGHDHHFQMGHPQFEGGYNRFQYGGYSFGYNQEWPAGWGYNDNVYVVYEDGGYFMYDLMHPGIHISLSIF